MEARGIGGARKRRGRVQSGRARYALDYTAKVTRHSSLPNLQQARGLKGCYMFLFIMKKMNYIV